MTIIATVYVVSALIVLAMIVAKRAYREGRNRNFIAGGMLIPGVNTIFAGLLVYDWIWRKRHDRD